MRAWLGRDSKPSNILVARAGAAGADGEPLIKVVDFGVSTLLPGDTDSGGSQSGERQKQDSLDGAVAKTAANIAPLKASSAAMSPIQLSAASAARPREAPGILTQTGVIMGTPLYMAPELARGARLAQPASDMFGFGMIAYELTTGRLPSDMPPMFLGLKPHQRWYTPLSVRCPELPAHIGDLIERCLDVSPDSRPSAAELAAALA